MRNVIRLLVILFILANYSHETNAYQNLAEADTTVYVAIMMGGGISLGSYEAGVLAELMYRFEDYNQTNKERKFVIDIMAGASAGSVTLGIVGDQMYNNNNIEPGGSVLHEIWVDFLNVTKPFAI